MSTILKIGLTKDHNKEIIETNEINLIAGKGVIGDRHFKDYNDPLNQLSIIESENIDEYNLKYKLNIPYLNFRRNIVTKGIKLNDLVEKEILIGSVKLEVIDLINFITVGISLGPTIMIVIIRMMEISIQPKENITGPYFDYLD